MLFSFLILLISPLYFFNTKQDIINKVEFLIISIFGCQLFLFGVNCARGINTIEELLTVCISFTLLIFMFVYKIDSLKRIILFVRK